uniref:Auxin-responsive protein n=1 Tax=Arundo donax TaxID=35708 RepID=A0A0A8XN49_ARUDO
MAWSGRIGETGDSGLELSLGLPAYFSKSSAPGLDAAVEGPSDSSAFALQAGKGSNGSTASVRPTPTPVVGWPPVRSFRRNLASSRPPPQSSSAHQDGGAKDGSAERGQGGLFVKINMDGVPIGRKVDLRAYGGYAELSAAVGKLFRGLLAAQRDPAAAAADKFFEEEVELGMDGGSGEYTLVYEDEEGDRVLVGDVPWE